MVSRSALKELCESCKDLLLYSENLQVDNVRETMRNDEKIRHALRKILIANEISDRMIICVTGLQGTGKSTLVKNYFNLGEDVLNITVGRGERLPILFTAKKGRSSAALFAFGIKKEGNGYTDFRIEVQPDEFKKLSAAEDDEKDRTVMYLEVETPAVDELDSDRISWMLLPGYERKDDYWNALIEFSVQCSDTAILALTPSAVSNKVNEDLMNRMKKRFGDNLIFALTHSDEQADGNKAVRETLMTIMNIEDEGRIVCTGAYMDKTKNAQWRAQLRKAVDTYASNLQSLDEKWQKYITKVIREEIKPACYVIKQNSRNSEESQIVSNSESDAMLRSFDKKTANMRKRYKKALDEQMKQAWHKDEEKLREEIEKIGPWRGIKRNLIGSGLKDDEKTMQLIERSMQDENGAYRFGGFFAAAITSCIESEKVIEQSGNDVALIPEAESSKNEGLIRTLPKESQTEIVTDISNIMSPTSNGKVVLKHENVDHTISALVELSTKYIGEVALCQVYPQQGNELPRLSNVGNAEDIKKSIGETEKFVYKVLGVTGLDFAQDGVLNFVPAVAKAMGISATVAGFAVGGIIAAGTVTSVLKDYHRAQREDFYSCQRAVAQIYDQVKDSYLDFFDEKMGMVRDRFKSYIDETKGINRDMINVRNTEAALNKIQDVVNQITREINEKQYDAIELVR